ncbi:hypothetical protein AB0L14_34540 [Streptomyces sp. NPDC052727]|uniref:hypothetical protein n=1 Tax=Streptomyces sp. NPDC052727 TaxID=3154854 RepID=UPI00343FEE56
MHIFKVVGCIGLLVALVGCGSSESDAVVPSEKLVEATASMDPNSITVLVTFIGGPADGRTEHLPLSQVTGKVAVAGVTYQSNPGLPPEVKDTPEGLAQVMRPV